MEEAKIEKIKKNLDEVESSLTGDHLIRDNWFQYRVDGKSYRCKMPSIRDQAEAEEERNSYKNILYQKKGQLAKNRLKKILKENQDIDIDEMEKEIRKKLDEVIAISVHTATLENEEKIQEAKDKVEKINEEVKDLSIRVSEYLSSSIEAQIDKKFIEYLTWKCTEKLEEEKWVPVWSKLEDYENATSTLAEKAVIYFDHLYSYKMSKR